MKKQLIILSLALLLAGCGSGSGSAQSTDSGTTESSPDTQSSEITPETVAEVSDWSLLAPYLEYALGSYASDVPSYNVHAYRVGYTEVGDNLAVQVDCLNLVTETAETNYTAKLENNDFTAVDNDPLYAYKMVSTYDCMYVYYAQTDTTFSILAYCATVRTAEWPSETAHYITGHDVPVCEADAYYCYYGVNGYNFITLYVEAFSNDGTGALSNWLTKLSKAGYEVSNQYGYYTAYSQDGEVVISFMDYYGDGTDISLEIYSLWAYPDYVAYFGFDLPRYNGDTTGFETKFISGTQSDYLCVYYDGVGSDCLATYGKQLLDAGFTYDSSFVSDTSTVYYLEGTGAAEGEEPWVQLAYQASSNCLCIAIPYIVEE